MRGAEAKKGARLDEPVDIVVTSSAGYPLDLTFYQSVKGMTAALPIVKDGGTIIIVARCAEGLGSPDFQGLLLETPSAQAFMEQLEDPDFFVIDQWQLQELCKVLLKIRVVLVSEGIEPEHRGRILVDHASSVEEAVEQALERHGQQACIAAIPKGPYVLTQVEQAR